MVKSQSHRARQKFWIIILGIVPSSRRLSEYKVGLSRFDGFVESYKAVAYASFWGWPLILSLEMLHKMLKDSKDVQGYFYIFPLLLNSFILLFVYLSILPTCMSVYPWGSAEGVGSPKTGITNICESLCGSRGLNQGLLKEQTGILAT